MKARAHWVVICLCLAATFYAFTAKAQEPAAQPAFSWEHLAITSKNANIQEDKNLAQQINRVGNDGWELVNVTAVQKNGTTEKMVFCFKRPK